MKDTSQQIDEAEYEKNSRWQDVLSGRIEGDH